VDLIDVHNHVMPAETLDLLRRDPDYRVTIDGDRWSGAHHVPFTIAASFHDPAAKIAEMDAKGIGSAVVSCPPPLLFYEVSSDSGARLCETANDGMAKFCGGQPSRLRWLANLPLQDPPRATQMYTAALEAGCVGVSIGTSIAGARLDEPRFEEFWAAAEEAGRPVLVHPAFNEPNPALEPYYLQNVIGNPLETTVMAERMICAGVFSRHPALRVILLHGGGFLPYQAGRLAHACGVRPEITITADAVWQAFGQLYFDTITHNTAALRYLAGHVGTDRVLLGTDLPFDMALAEPAEALAEAFNYSERSAIGSANAARLFGLVGMRGAPD
jgi:aminocarboxymuconate-semialdehyde decarboxylase